MTKKEFIKRIIDMEHPVMKFGSDHSSDYLNCWCLVRDREDNSKRFNVFNCRCSQNEYFNGNISTYENREKALRIKFEKWLHDVCGNYCTVRDTDKIGLVNSLPSTPS